MFSTRLIELPMPTGSTDADVLTDWILHSLGLIRRRDENGGLQRIMRDALLADPLKGWKSSDLGEATGLSNTAIFQQIKKLKSSGLVSTETRGKWDYHILRGGSMTNAVEISTSIASTILDMRLSTLAGMVEPSETRMEVDSEVEEAKGLSLTISEIGPRRDGFDDTSELVMGLGLGGDSDSGIELASKLLDALCSDQQPVTILALSERMKTTRGRVKTSIDRMSEAGIVEAVPMVQRLSMDIFSSLNRQNSARGTDWLMGRGGLSRLDDSVSSALIQTLSEGDGIERVGEILAPVPVESQRILLNLLGGRLPFGYRISGKDGKAVSESISRAADRSLRRIRTVAKRLDDSLTS